MKKLKFKELEILTKNQLKEIKGGYSPGWKCVNGLGTQVHGIWSTTQTQCINSCPPPVGSCVWAAQGPKGF